MVNYYRDMWPKRSKVLAPLTELCSKTTKFQWTERQQKAFEEIKRIVAKETLLAYPDFNQPFITSNQIYEVEKAGLKVNAKKSFFPKGEL